MTGEVSFETALKYPFNKKVRLLNILWLFLPIIGWFALGGYSIVIVRSFLNAEFKEVPEFNFGSNLSLGFFMFLKSLPFAICYGILSTLVSFIPLGFLIQIFLGFFIVPILAINFFKHATIESYFEFDKVNVVFDNFVDYLVATLKGIGLGIVLLFLPLVALGGFAFFSQNLMAGNSIVTILLFVLMVCLFFIFLPANFYTKHIFIADFYRRNVK
jgi:hypothetical protein